MASTAFQNTDHAARDGPALSTASRKQRKDPEYGGGALPHRAAVPRAEIRFMWAAVPGGVRFRLGSLVVMCLLDVGSCAVLPV
jgi:hypothetical protein